jgi:hypothetical protein
MPVALINPNSRIDPGYFRPDSGKVKIHVESTNPVDVFIASNEQATRIHSLADARAMGVLTYDRRMTLDDVVTLPTGWLEGRWKLVIGNDNATHAAVYYTVLNA